MHPAGRGRRRRARIRHTRPVVVIPRRQPTSPTSFKRRRASRGHGRAAAQGRGRADWRDVTAGEFRDEVTALAKGLIAAGIEPGDRVALMSRTRYEWTLIDYAIWAAGAVTRADLRDLLGRAGGVDPGRLRAPGRCSLETPAHEQAVAEVRRQAAHGGTALADRGRGRGHQPLDALPADGNRRQRRAVRAAPRRARRRRPGHDHLHLRHDRAAEEAASSPTATCSPTCATRSRARSEIFEIAGRSALLFLPLAHSFARIIQVGCLESGDDSRAHARHGQLLEDLASFQPTFILAVPRVFEKVYNGAEAAGVRRARSRAGSSVPPPRPPSPGARPSAARASRPGPRRPAAPAGARPVRPARLRQAAGGDRRAGAVTPCPGVRPLGERLGHFFRGAGITILEGYGLTETSAGGHREPAGP